MGISDAEIGSGELRPSALAGPADCVRRHTDTAEIDLPCSDGHPNGPLTDHT